MRKAFLATLKKIAEYGLMSMPALVLNGKVVSAGKVLKPADIVRLISE